MDMVVGVELGTFVKVSLLPLLVIAYIFYRSAQQAATDLTLGPHKEFALLQRKYFLPYFMALFSDWLQGPYVYKLYSYYGYAQDEIAILYITGFAASVTFGTATGPLADKFGRKRMCVAFCLLYALCCVTKLSPSFDVLLAGRVLGGISTSILFSVFESWYIHQHTIAWKYPLEWLSITFSKSTFFNGLLAIIAGIVAEIGADYISIGPVAPFIIAIPFLLIAAYIIHRSWEENTGQQELNWRSSCLEGLTTIVRSPKILALGLVQSIFESSMYIFVFLWTPVLESGKPPLGLTFSSFMVAIMIGSSVYSHLLNRGLKSDKILTICLMLMSAVMFFCAVCTSPQWKQMEIPIFSAFIVLEVAVGLYFPAIGYLRGETIPDHLRANIMNWFRVPMNAMTCGGLIGMHKLETQNANQLMFFVCGVCSVVGLVISIAFTRLSRKGGDPLVKEAQTLT